MAQHHYLGDLAKIGHTLWYVATYEQEWVALLSFSASALKCAARDKWIGWDFRRQYGRLKLIANNSRFLILPWVHIANLASVMLSRALRRVRQDWEARYGVEPLLVETLVDAHRYRGHCYRAANWIWLGHTSGRGRMDREHRREGASPKAVWVFPLAGNAAQRLRAQR